MSTPTLTLQLPEDIYHRLQTVATTMRQSLEAVVVQTIQSNLPPALDDAPPDMLEELSGWPTLSDTALWHITQEPLPAAAWRRHQTLLRRNETGRLTAVEQDELNQRRTRVDRFVLRRAYALALLKWRGYVLPAAPVASHAASPKNSPRHPPKRRRAV